MTAFRFCRPLIFTSLLWCAMIPALHANDSTGGVTPVEQVDPLISTGGNRYVCGNNPPAATVPFGMVRLGPDTISADGTPALNMSGYYYHDPHIIGFSHTRLCGTGAIDGGHFRVFADRADVPLAERRQQLRASFDHEHESASPGFYSVELPDFQVTAEMTATRRVGLHRYRFAAGQAPRILIDVGSALGRGRSEACEVHVDSENREITGTTRTYGSFSGRYGGLQVYFAAKFRQPWQTCSIWTDSRIDVEGTDAAGNDVCVACTFAEDKTTVELVVALSHVSIENARQNLNGEVAERSFDEIHEAAIVEWNTLLSTVKIDGGTDTDRKIFYTALYHSCMMPTVFSDVNGQYLGFDKQTHQVEDFEYYTDMSLWDTFRTTHPLFTLLTPGRQRDMLVSLVKMAEQGGNLPCWPSGGGYTNSMFGSPADIVIADAWLKGIRGFDVDTAYMMMRKTAMEPAPMGAVYSGREGIADYVKYGYCPSDTMSGAVAHTLEYATTDAAIGQLAAALGKTEDADLFARRGQNYRQLWNPETQYFQPRDTSGKFSTPLMPTLLTYVDIAGKITDDYVEGSALQWRWAVSHDAAGLVSLFSSKEEFVQELSEFFANSSEFVGALPNGYYWHGNQPDIHAVYLFNAAGRPDLTQKWVRWILKHKHGEGPDGLDGNDDGGTLSAWYVFSSLGFYPVVGTDRYELGSPLWKRAVVKMGDKSLEIVTDNYAPEHVYVDHVELNGKSLDRWWVSHAEIADGGTLRFVMSDRVAE